MKFTALFLLTIILVLALGPFFSYPYLMGGILLLAYLMGTGGGLSFLAGGLGMGLVWLGKALYISIQSSTTLPDKMASLMGMEESNLLWIATGLLGFCLGGFSALTGSLLRNLFQKNAPPAFINID